MEALQQALDRAAAEGRRLRFWLRDDDAVEPSAALDRLLALTAGRVPLALAVIPAFTGQALADRLAGQAQVTVAVHGWAHANHAGEGEKKQELGAHRPVAVVLDELARGLAHLTALYGPRAAPVLVPPWNRIDPAVVAGLPGHGFRALSVFGPPKPAPLRMINSTVDIMDWHGTRGGRSDDALLAEVLAGIDRDAPIGILTHHLVHDAQAWGFLDRLFTVTSGHPGCLWVGLPALVAE